MRSLVVVRYVGMMSLATALAYGTPIVTLPASAPRLEAQPAKAAAAKEQTGVWRGFRYFYSRDKASGRYAALFQPRMLPRDDATVVGMIQHLVQDAYKANIAGSTPRLMPVSHAGRTVNAIGFVVPAAEGTWTYYALLIKEETGPSAGQVHSMVIWREKM